MRFYLMCLIGLISISPLIGQTSEEEAFQTLFEDLNIGNLHVYIPQEDVNPKKDFYDGVSITPVYNSLLPNDIRYVAGQKQKKHRAIYAVRGNDLDVFYMIHVKGDQGEEQIVLYDMVDGDLREKLTLAYLDCNDNGQCKQLDSWLQDLNGDGLVDVIQRAKSKFWNRIKTRVYLMYPDGSFERSKSFEVDEKDYRMEGFFQK